MRHGLHYDLEKLLERAYDSLERFPGLLERPAVISEAIAFILERLAKVLTDDGLARDTVDAVLSVSRDFLDLRARALALHEFRAGSSWEDLVTVFTRPSNLARQLPAQAAVEVAGHAPGGVSPALFQAEAEPALFAAWQEVADKVAAAIEAKRYGDALAVLAGLRPVVDRYFDDVLVMAEDEAVRINRLRQLAAVAATVRRVAWLELVHG
jgi:glycyl-tRNA synthetase beta chain